MVKIILGGRVSVDFWNGLLRFWGHELRGLKKAEGVKCRGVEEFCGDYGLGYLCCKDDLRWKGCQFILEWTFMIFGSRVTGA